MDLERILIIDSGYLFSEHGALKNKKDAETKAVPWEDVAALMIEGFGVSLSLGVIQECAFRGIHVVFTNPDYSPAASLYGPAQHIHHRELLRSQMDNDFSHIWTAVVSNKIRNQRECLLTTGLANEDVSMKRMFRLSQTEAGAPTIRESHAARIYWENMYSHGFRRRKRGAEDAVNSRLNFGYAILRSYLSRYIVLAGLHPGIGINHSNQRNPFCLADDLIEPFRPSIDYLVSNLDLSCPFGAPETKKPLLGVLSTTGCLKGKNYALTSLLRQYVLDFSKVIQGTASELPEVELVF